MYEYMNDCLSQRPQGLRRRSTAASLLRSWSRSEFYRLWRVVCDHETSCYEEATARAELQSQRNELYDWLAGVNIPMYKLYTHLNVLQN
jgi:hypothetical protein